MASDEALPNEHAANENEPPAAKTPAKKKRAAKKKTAVKKAAKKKTSRSANTADSTPQQTEIAYDAPKAAPVAKKSGGLLFSSDDDPGPEPSEKERSPEREAPTPAEVKESGSDDAKFESVASRPEFGGHAQALNKAGGGHPHQQSGNPGEGQGRNRNRRKKEKFKKERFPKKSRRGRGRGGAAMRYAEEDTGLELGTLQEDETLNSFEGLQKIVEEIGYASDETLRLDDVYRLSIQELRDLADDAEIEFDAAPSRIQVIQEVLRKQAAEKRPIHISGVFDPLGEEDTEAGLLVYAHDNYRQRALSAFVPECLVKHFGIQPGHTVEATVLAPREEESCPVVIEVKTIMGRDPEAIQAITPFTELIPYYPTERILLETPKESDIKITWDDTSMRTADICAPVGFGQRGIIVAPPRAGKTMLMQSIAHSIQENFPKAHMMILLVDERPEEVTDFKRRVHDGVEVIASTFDENAESHVHAAEVVIEKARRMVECGEDVVLLLDSITRLARAYNTMMPSSGKILSGGVEANALQKPKRFFGSARNIEGGGSLTILATALVETGSKMDEVIFEEFKGTGNMELHLDRELVNKRIFPALSFEKSGTRKEELLYHPEELAKIYSLRRAMKGVPSVEAMEMLIQRIKKSRSNTEFLLTLNR